MVFTWIGFRVVLAAVSLGQLGRAFLQGLRAAIEAVSAGPGGNVCLTVPTVGKGIGGQEVTETCNRCDGRISKALGRWHEDMKRDQILSLAGSLDVFQAFKHESITQALATCP